MSKAAYLVAAAGNPNFGDDLIAAYWIRYLRELSRDREIIIDCLNPANFSILLHRFDLLSRVRVVDTVWKLATSVGAHGLSLETSTALQGIEFPSRERRNIAWPIHELRGEISSLHFVGGGYLSEVWPTNLSMLAIGAWLKKFWNCPIYLTGAGFHVWSEMTAYEMSLALLQFDYVSLRSGLAVHGLNSLAVVPDDVFLGAPTQTVAPDDSLLTIQVQRDSFSPSDFAKVATQVRHFSSTWMGRVEAVCLYPGMDDVFLDSLEEAGQPIPRVGYSDYFARFMGTTMPVVGVSVGTRYHFHFLQAAAGSRGAFAVSGDYYRTKHAVPLEAGSHWASMPEISQERPAIDTMGLRRQKLKEAQRLYS